MIIRERRALDGTAALFSPWLRCHKRMGLLRPQPIFGRLVQTLVLVIVLSAIGCLLFISSLGATPTAVVFATAQLDDAAGTTRANETASNSTSMTESLSWTEVSPTTSFTRNNTTKNGMDAESGTMTASTPLDNASVTASSSSLTLLRYTSRSISSPFGNGSRTMSAEGEGERTTSGSSSTASVEAEQRTSSVGTTASGSSLHDGLSESTTTAPTASSSLTPTGNTTSKALAVTETPSHDPIPTATESRFNESTRTLSADAVTSATESASASLTYNTSTHDAGPLSPTGTLEIMTKSDNTTTEGTVSKTTSLSVSMTPSITHTDDTSTLAADATASETMNGTLSRSSLGNEDSSSKTLMESSTGSLEVSGNTSTAEALAATPTATVGSVSASLNETSETESSSLSASRSLSTSENTTTVEPDDTRTVTEVVRTESGEGSESSSTLTESISASESDDTSTAEALDSPTLTLQNATRSEKVTGSESESATSSVSPSLSDNTLTPEVADTRTKTAVVPTSTGEESESVSLSESLSSSISASENTSTVAPEGTVTKSGESSNSQSVEQSGASVSVSASETVSYSSSAGTLTEDPVRTRTETEIVRTRSDERTETDSSSATNSASASLSEGSPTHLIVETPTVTEVVRSATREESESESASSTRSATSPSSVSEEPPQTRTETVVVATNTTEVSGTPIVTESSTYSTSQTASLEPVQTRTLTLFTATEEPTESHTASTTLSRSVSRTDGTLTLEPPQTRTATFFTASESAEESVSESISESVSLSKTPTDTMTVEPPETPTISLFSNSPNATLEFTPSATTSVSVSEAISDASPSLEMTNTTYTRDPPVTISATFSESVNPTESVTERHSLTPTASETADLSTSISAEQSPSVSISYSSTMSESSSSTITPTRSFSASETASSSTTLTRTYSASTTATMTGPTPSSTASRTPSQSSTLGVSVSVTVMLTGTLSTSVTTTRTETLSTTVSSSVSESASTTATATISVSPSSSHSATASLPIDHHEPTPCGLYALASLVYFMPSCTLLKRIDDVADDVAATWYGEPIVDVVTSAVVQPQSQQGRHMRQQQQDDIDSSSFSQPESSSSSSSPPSSRDNNNKKTIAEGNMVNTFGYRNDINYPATRKVERGSDDDGDVGVASAADGGVGAAVGRDRSFNPQQADSTAHQTVTSASAAANGQSVTSLFNLPPPSTTSGSTGEDDLPMCASGRLPVSPRSWLAPLRSGLPSAAALSLATRQYVGSSDTALVGTNQQHPINSSSAFYEQQSVYRSALRVVASATALVSRTVLDTSGAWSRRSWEERVRSTTSSSSSSSSTTNTNFPRPAPSEPFGTITASILHIPTTGSTSSSTPATPANAAPATSSQHEQEVDVPHRNISIVSFLRDKTRNLDGTDGYQDLPRVVGTLPSDWYSRIVGGGRSGGIGGDAVGVGGGAAGLPATAQTLMDSATIGAFGFVNIRPRYLATQRRTMEAIWLDREQRAAVGGTASGGSSSSSTSTTTGSIPIAPPVGVTFSNPTQQQPSSSSSSSNTPPFYNTNKAYLSPTEDYRNTQQASLFAATHGDGVVKKRERYEDEGRMWLRFLDTVFDTAIVQAVMGSTASTSGDLLDSDRVENSTPRRTTDMANGGFDPSPLSAAADSGSSSSSASSSSTPTASFASTSMFTPAQQRLLGTIHNGNVLYQQLARYRQRVQSYGGSGNGVGGINGSSSSSTASNDNDGADADEYLSPCGNYCLPPLPAPLIDAFVVGEPMGRVSMADVVRIDMERVEEDEDFFLIVEGDGGDGGGEVDTTVAATTATTLPSATTTAATTESTITEITSDNAAAITTTTAGTTTVVSTAPSMTADGETVVTTTPTSDDVTGLTTASTEGVVTTAINATGAEEYASQQHRGFDVASLVGAVGVDGGNQTGTPATTSSSSQQTTLPSVSPTSPSTMPSVVTDPTSSLSTPATTSPTTATTASTPPPSSPANTPSRHRRRALRLAANEAESWLDYALMPTEEVFRRLQRYTSIRFVVRLPSTPGPYRGLYRFNEAGVVSSGDATGASTSGSSSSSSSSLPAAHVQLSVAPRPAVLLALDSPHGACSSYDSHLTLKPSVTSAEGSLLSMVLQTNPLAPSIDVSVASLKATAEAARAAAAESDEVIVDASTSAGRVDMAKVASLFRPSASSVAQPPSPVEGMGADVQGVLSVKLVNPTAAASGGLQQQEQQRVFDAMVIDGNLPVTNSSSSPEGDADDGDYSTSHLLQSLAVYVKRLLGSLSGWASSSTTSHGTEERGRQQMSATPAALATSSLPPSSRSSRRRLLQDGDAQTVLTTTENNATTTTTTHEVTSLPNLTTASAPASTSSTNGVSGVSGTSSTTTAVTTDGTSTVTSADVTSPISTASASAPTTTAASGTSAGASGTTVPSGDVTATTVQPLTPSMLPSGITTTATGVTAPPMPPATSTPATTALTSTTQPPLTTTATAATTPTTTVVTTPAPPRTTGVPGGEAPLPNTHFLITNYPSATVISGTPMLLPTPTAEQQRALIYFYLSLPVSGSSNAAPSGGVRGMGVGLSAPSHSDINAVLAEAEVAQGGGPSSSSSSAGSAAPLPTDAAVALEQDLLSDIVQHGAIPSGAVAVAIASTVGGLFSPATAMHTAMIAGLQRSMLCEPRDLSPPSSLALVATGSESGGAPSSSSADTASSSSSITPWYLISTAFSSAITMMDSPFMPLFYSNSGGGGALVEGIEGFGDDSKPRAEADRATILEVTATRMLRQQEALLAQAQALTARPSSSSSSSSSLLTPTPLMHTITWSLWTHVALTPSSPVERPFDPRNLELYRTAIVGNLIYFAMMCLLFLLLGKLVQLLRRWLAWSAFSGNNSSNDADGADNEESSVSILSSIGKILRPNAYWRDVMTALIGWPTVLWLPFAIICHGTVAVAVSIIHYYAIVLQYHAAKSFWTETPAVARGLMQSLFFALQSSRGGGSSSSSSSSTSTSSSSSSVYNDDDSSSPSSYNYPTKYLFAPFSPAVMATDWRFTVMMEQSEVMDVGSSGSANGGSSSSTTTTYSAAVYADSNVYYSYNLANATLDLALAGVALFLVLVMILMVYSCLSTLLSSADVYDITEAGMGVGGDGKKSTSSSSTIGRQTSPCREVSPSPQRRGVGGGRIDAAADKPDPHIIVDYYGDYNGDDDPNGVDLDLYTLYDAGDNAGDESFYGGSTAGNGGPNRKNNNNNTIADEQRRRRHFLAKSTASAKRTSAAENGNHNNVCLLLLKWLGSVICCCCCCCLRFSRNTPIIVGSFDEEQRNKRRALNRKRGISTSAAAEDRLDELDAILAYRQAKRERMITKLARQHDRERVLKRVIAASSAVVGGITTRVTGGGGGAQNPYQHSNSNHHNAFNPSNANAASMAAIMDDMFNDDVEASLLAERAVLEELIGPSTEADQLVTFPAMTLMETEKLRSAAFAQEWAEGLLQQLVDVRESCYAARRAALHKAVKKDRKGIATAKAKEEAALNEAKRLVSAHTRKRREKKMGESAVGGREEEAMGGGSDGGGGVLNVPALPQREDGGEGITANDDPNTDALLYSNDHHTGEGNSRNTVGSPDGGGDGEDDGNPFADIFDGSSIDENDSIFCGGDDDLLSANGSVGGVGGGVGHTTNNNASAAAGAPFQEPSLTFSFISNNSSVLTFTEMGDMGIGGRDGGGHQQHEQHQRPAGVADDDHFFDDKDSLFGEGGGHNGAGISMNQRVITNGGAEDFESLFGSSSSNSLLSDDTNNHHRGKRDAALLTGAADKDAPQSLGTHSDADHQLEPSPSDAAFEAYLYGEETREGSDNHHRHPSQQATEMQPIPLGSIGSTAAASGGLDQLPVLYSGGGGYNGDDQAHPDEAANGSTTIPRPGTMATHQNKQQQKRTFTDISAIEKSGGAKGNTAPAAAVPTAQSPTQLPSGSPSSRRIQRIADAIASRASTVKGTVTTTANSTMAAAAYAAKAVYEKRQTQTVLRWWRYWFQRESEWLLVPRNTLTRRVGLRYARLLEDSDLFVSLTEKATRTEVKKHRRKLMRRKLEQMIILQRREMARAMAAAVGGHDEALFNSNDDDDDDNTAFGNAASNNEDAILSELLEVEAADQRRQNRKRKKLSDLHRSDKKQRKKERKKNKRDDKTTASSKYSPADSGSEADGNRGYSDADDDDTAAIVAKFADRINKKAVGGGTATFAEAQLQRLMEAQRADDEAAEAEAGDVLSYYHYHNHQSSQHRSAKKGNRSESAAADEQLPPTLPPPPLPASALEHILAFHTRRSQYHTEALFYPQRHSCVSRWINRHQHLIQNSRWRFYEPTLALIAGVGLGGLDGLIVTSIGVCQIRAILYAVLIFIVLVLVLLFNTHLVRFQQLLLVLTLLCALTAATMAAALAFEPAPSADGTFRPDQLLIVFGFCITFAFIGVIIIFITNGIGMLIGLIRSIATAITLGRRRALVEEAVHAHRAHRLSTAAYRQGRRMLSSGGNNGSGTVGGFTNLDVKDDDHDEDYDIVGRPTGRRPQKSSTMPSSSSATVTSSLSLLPPNFNINAFTNDKGDCTSSDENDHHVRRAEYVFAKCGEGVGDDAGKGNTNTKKKKGGTTLSPSPSTTTTTDPTRYSVRNVNAILGERQLGELLVAASAAGGEGDDLSPSTNNDDEDTTAQQLHGHAVVGMDATMRRHRRGNGGANASSPSQSLPTVGRMNAYRSHYLPQQQFVLLGGGGGNSPTSASSIPADAGNANNNVSSVTAAVGKRWTDRRNNLTFAADETTTATGARASVAHLLQLGGEGDGSLGTAPANSGTANGGGVLQPVVLDVNEEDSDGGVGRGRAAMSSPRSTAPSSKRGVGVADEIEIDFSTIGGGGGGNVPSTSSTTNANSTTAAPTSTTTAYTLQDLITRCEADAVDLSAFVLPPPPPPAGVLLDRAAEERSRIDTSTSYGGGTASVGDALDATDSNAGGHRPRIDETTTATAVVDVTASLTSSSPPRLTTTDTNASMAAKSFLADHMSRRAAQAAAVQKMQRRVRRLQAGVAVMIGDDDDDEGDDAAVSPNKSTTQMSVMMGKSNISTAANAAAPNDASMATLASSSLSSPRSPPRLVPTDGSGVRGMMVTKDGKH